MTVAALDESDERVVEEAADLVYHLYVLLAARGLDIAAVEDELRARQRDLSLIRRSRTRLTSFDPRSAGRRRSGCRSPRSR